MERQRSTAGVWRLFSLRADQAGPEVIDDNIRSNARIAGTNLWVLGFAIVIACVGLNVNSTAVIIGAMLISPLMGPIIGIGYGASIFDGPLIRASFRSLGLFLAISLAASTLYFLLSPLTEAHAELLARTSPTMWDVLIAFFGGAAGMVGLSRKEKTTLIPGVAIATALMPPVCTVGFGIATGQTEFIIGAGLLFLINAVFIALATLLVARVLRLPLRGVVDDHARRRGRVLIAIAVLATVVPAGWLTLRLVRDELFVSAINRFVRATIPAEDVLLLSYDVDARRRSAVVTVLGAGVTDDFEERLTARLAATGIGDASIKVRRPTGAPPGGVPRSRDGEALLIRTLAEGEKRAARIAELEAQVARIQSTVAEFNRIEAEIAAQLPVARRVVIGGSLAHDAKGPHVRVLVALDSPRLSAAEIERLERWMRVRLPEREIHISYGRINDATAESALVASQIQLRR